MTHDPVLVENTREWVGKAVRDLRRAERLIREPDIEDALFHCQQAAEKAVKAFLVWHDRQFPKTHDLDVLSKLAATDDADIAAVAHRAAPLTMYVWMFRYPGAKVAPTSDEARQSPGARQRGLPGGHRTAAA